MKNVTLNENEKQVLMACMNEIVHCTGCEFGCSTDVIVDDMTKNQIKGYLSVLQTKKLITTWNNEDKTNNFSFTKEGCKALFNTELTDDQIEKLNDIDIEIY